MYRRIGYFLRNIIFIVTASKLVQFINFLEVNNNKGVYYNFEGNMIDY